MGQPRHHGKESIRFGRRKISVLFFGAILKNMERHPLRWSWARCPDRIGRRPPKSEVVGSNPTGPARYNEQILFYNEALA